MKQEYKECGFLKSPQGLRGWNEAANRQGHQVAETGYREPNGHQRYFYAHH